jgi:hypothetical protein
MKALAVLVTLPYRAVLSMLRPWGRVPRVRKLARSLLAPFLFLNTLWLGSPILLVLFLLRGEVGWLAVVVVWLLVALPLHSLIAHATDSALKAWDGGWPS